jgi:hypothetical protein
MVIPSISLSTELGPSVFAAQPPCRDRWAGQSVDEVTTTLNHRRPVMNIFSAHPSDLVSVLHPVANKRSSSVHCIGTTSV